MDVALRGLQAFDSAAHAKRNLRKAIERVARRRWGLICGLTMQPNPAHGPRCSLR